MDALLSDSPDVLTEDSTGRILVRNIDQAVLIKLKALAEQNERSLEAECRLAIREWAARQNACRTDKNVLLDMKLMTSDCKTMLHTMIETFSKIVLDDDRSYSVTIQIAALGKTGTAN